ncbi:unnamed protein product [Amoebophrya sp. A120]|nr:unnamed protein product [Amoebophrya sp. A120]|eukprot:GSA120T00010409001.1
MSSAHYGRVVPVALQKFRRLGCWPLQKQQDSFGFFIRLLFSSGDLSQMREKLGTLVKKRILRSTPLHPNYAYELPGDLPPGMHFVVCLTRLRHVYRLDSWLNLRRGLDTVLKQKLKLNQVVSSPDHNLSGQKTEQAGESKAQVGRPSCSSLFSSSSLGGGGAQQQDSLRCSPSRAEKIETGENEKVKGNGPTMKRDECVLKSSDMFVKKPGPPPQQEAPQRSGPRTTTSLRHNSHREYGAYPADGGCLRTRTAFPAASPPAPTCGLLLSRPDEDHARTSAGVDETSAAKTITSVEEEQDNDKQRGNENTHVLQQDVGYYQVDELHQELPKVLPNNVGLSSSGDEMRMYVVCMLPIFPLTRLMWHFFVRRWRNKLEKYFAEVRSLKDHSHSESTTSIKSCEDPLGEEAGKIEFLTTVTWKSQYFREMKLHEDGRAWGFLVKNDGEILWCSDEDFDEDTQGPMVEKAVEEEVQWRVKRQALLLGEMGGQSAGEKQRLVE